MMWSFVKAYLSIVLCTTVASTVARVTTAADCELCNEQEDPVCGSDGNTYANECELAYVNCTENQNVTIISRGWCTVDSINTGNSSSNDGCPEVCTMELHYVCGSNNITYDNDCLLQIAMCHDSTITKLTDSACDDVDNNSSPFSSSWSSSASGQSEDAIVSPDAGTDPTNDEESVKNTSGVGYQVDWKIIVAWAGLVSVLIAQ